MNVNGLGPEAFSYFFRQASPYIIAHQGSVVVIVIPGTVMTQPKISRASSRTSRSCNPSAFASSSSSAPPNRSTPSSRIAASSP